jgi:TonB family protein
MEAHMPFVAFLFASMLANQSASNSPQVPGCGQALALGPSSSAVEMCLGEEQVRQADAAAKDRSLRSRRLEIAAGHYRRAARLAAHDEARARALVALTRIHGAEHLDRPDQIESVLHELIALEPDNLSHVFGLAQLQEKRGLIDAAETNLLGTRYQHPDAVEPYMMLAQFYSRRALARRIEIDRQSPGILKPAVTSGERDQDGVYRVGGAVPPPRRVGLARYPPEALAAGIQGVVIVELVIDEWGSVTDTKVLRSIPLLDGAALAAVRNWQYAPTIVDGQKVPARIAVTVNFVPPEATPSPQPPR